MFVRIKKTPVYSPGNRRVSDYSLRFLVVESQRRDGVPRQKIIKYLGSVRASKLQSASYKHQFLSELQRKLRTSGFDPMEQAKLHVSLIRCVIHHSGVKQKEIWLILETLTQWNHLLRDSQDFKKGWCSMPCKYLTGLKIPGCLASDSLMYPSLYELKTLCNCEFQKCHLYCSKNKILPQEDTIKKDQQRAELDLPRRNRTAS